MEHLGALVNVALYVNDRQIREVRYSHELSKSIGYEVRIWPLPPTGSLPLDVSDKPVLTGVLAIDFANTACAKSLSVREGFSDYAMLVDWLRGCGAITNEDVTQLHSLAADNEPGAQSVLAEATKLRDALIATLRDHATGSDETAALDAISETLRRYRAGGKLVWKDGSCVTEWPPVSADLTRTLWPIAASVENVLLTDRARQRVRRCAAADCDRLFLDNSRNGTRQWCSMGRCGSLAKVRRFRQRHRVPKVRASH